MIRIGISNTNIRKARVNDIKREYRSLKRSEKQIIKKREGVSGDTPRAQLGEHGRGL
jgi:hypothetical protein